MPWTRILPGDYKFSSIKIGSYACKILNRFIILIIINLEIFSLLFTTKGKILTKNIFAAIPLIRPDYEIIPEINNSWVASKTGIFIIIDL